MEITNVNTFFEAYPAQHANSPLALELETFLAQQPAWLVTDRDRYVLIKGQDVIGLYDKQDEAFAEGYRRFRREAFMVQRIQESFDTYYFNAVA